jgi:hypothetical protein
MISVVGPDPELSDRETMPVVLLLRPAGQNADDEVPIRTLLKDDVIQDHVEEVTTESGLQPFVIPLRLLDLALARPTHGRHPLIAISLAWNQDENPCASLSERFVIEIGFCWPENTRSGCDPAKSGLLVIPLPSTNECSRYRFSGHHCLNGCHSGH